MRVLKRLGADEGTETAHRAALALRTPPFTPALHTGRLNTDVLIGVAGGDA